MNRVFIGIGSNEGDRLARMSEAVRLLGETDGVRVAQMAMIFETEPRGGPPQEPYLNTVLEIETALEPSALLGVCQEIERRLGRRPSAQRWSPRPIDLDLLLYDERIVEEPGLSIPHPRLHERRFVLAPLAQLAPELIHPTLRQPIRALAASIEGQRVTPLAAGSPLGPAAG